MNLTKRQTEIVEHLAMGETCEEVAETFSRSVLTVRTQVKQACQRVGARNIPHLVAISISQGFINVMPAIIAGVLIVSIALGGCDMTRRGPRIGRQVKRGAEYVISV